jgi:hypothetical protein
VTDPEVMAAAARVMRLSAVLLGRLKDTAIAPGPVVRACEDPQCRGYDQCPAAAADRARITGKTLAIREKKPAGSDTSDEVMARILAQDIAVSRPADTSGSAWLVPDGTEFRMHKSADGTCTALYSGPCSTLEEVFAGAVPWSEGEYAARLTAMRERHD